LSTNNSRMSFRFLIAIIVFIVCAITTQATSKYEGVSWNEKRNLWQAKSYINGKKRKFYFGNEFDAAKKLNKLCDKMEIPRQNPQIDEIPNLPKNYQETLQISKKCNKKRKSQYKSVYWLPVLGKWLVLIQPKEDKQKYGGVFSDELEAGKRVNQLCEQLGIPTQNPEISAIPNEPYQKKEKTSLYKGVHWYRKRGAWHVQLRLKGGKRRFGGYFKNEEDAGKRVNQLCEELGIPAKNPAINAMPNQQQLQKKEKTSHYKGVYWHRERKNWRVQLCIKGTREFGGNFKDEMDAAQKVNQICEEIGISPPNPKISTIPNQQKKENTSKYNGVYWHKQRKQWRAQLYVKGEKIKFGGIFKVEVEAAKRVNQLCEEMGISLKNPSISAIPNQKYQKKENTSQYKGVCWEKKNRKWRVQLCIKGIKSRFVEDFKNELDAAKKVNQICEEMGISPKNPDIVETTTQKLPVHDEDQTITNPVVSSQQQILKTDIDDAKNKKRKRTNDDDKFTIEYYYYYDHFLK